MRIACPVSYRCFWLSLLCSGEILAHIQHQATIPFAKSVLPATKANKTSALPCCSQNCQPQFLRTGNSASFYQGFCFCLQLAVYYPPFSSPYTSVGYAVIKLALWLFLYIELFLFCFVSQVLSVCRRVAPTINLRLAGCSSLHLWELWGSATPYSAVVA